ncbi:phage holin family protein [Virgibacillus alimentarius]|uniref:phage holin family protein n=1 Tax=Virgibacillus alimentarius TaxID=698769 RepID=UPI00049354E5|nr:MULTISPECIES: phage holin family protein [Virgibacillus]HLR69186.1 phage holin family protein [Virgibacillus sp.]
MEKSQEMHFYESKIRLIFLLILGVVFILFGVLVGIFAFNEGDLGMGALGAVLALFFAFCIVMGLKRLGNPGPYLTLTEEDLIINASSNNPIYIKWVDIEAFSIYKKNNNKFIGVILYDEEKYRDLMSDKMRKLYHINTVMHLPLYNITWGQIKRRDKERLLEELEGRISQNLQADGNDSV